MSKTPKGALKEWATHSHKSSNKDMIDNFWLFCDIFRRINESYQY